MFRLVYISLSLSVCSISAKKAQYDGCYSNDMVCLSRVAFKPGCIQTVLHSNRVRGIFSCVYVVQYGLKWEDPRAKFGSGIEPPERPARVAAEVQKLKVSESAW